jgi:predicted transposase/invertase (TIGR01784 family)
MEQTNGAPAMKARFINPYTDFGFKKLFGEEANKDLLKDFLNELLPVRHKIASLTLKSAEHIGAITTDRKAIFDIHCQDEQGGQFIVEMQKAKIKFFKDRAIFYTTFPIRDMAEKGDWDFKLKPVYCVAILDFTFDEEREKKTYLCNVQLKDQYCQVIFDKLTYIFIEMPRFTKGENELGSHLDRWLYFLKNLENFEDIPQVLKEEVFLKGFEIAELANFDPGQMQAYEDSLKTYRDLKGVIDTSHDEGYDEGHENGLKEGVEIGLNKGRKQEKLDMAQLMKKKGYAAKEISELTGLPPADIENL